MGPKKLMTEADVKRLVKQALEKAEEEKADEVQEEATTASESEEEERHSKKKKKKASGRKKKSKDTSGSSGSEGSDEDEFDDHLVDAWAPKNWKDASTMLQRFDGVEQTIMNRTMLGPHVRGELDFIRRLVKMSARFKDKKLQAIIGRRILIISLKSEFPTKGKDVEVMLGASMTSPKKWAKARAACRMKMGKDKDSGGIFRRGRGSFRGGGSPGFRGRGSGRGRAE